MERTLHRIKAKAPIINEATVQKWKCDKCGRVETVGNGGGITHLVKMGWRLDRSGRKNGVVLCRGCKRYYRRGEYVVVDGETTVGVWQLRVFSKDRTEILATNDEGHWVLIKSWEIVGPTDRLRSKRRGRKEDREEWVGRVYFGEEAQGSSHYFR